MTRAYPQPTRSRDGLARLTLRVEHRVARWLVEDALAHARYFGGLDRPTVSATLALSLSRDYLKRHRGEWREAIDPEDPLEGEREQAANAWAEQQVERLWPGWERGL